jgi:hypothetical protein
MELIQTYGKEIVALLVPFITWFLNSSQRSKAKLIRGVRHSFTFLVDQPLVDGNGQQVSPTQTARTASVVIQNIGKKTANNVQIVFNWKPMCINTWPNRVYEEETLPDGRYARSYDTLSPQEFIGIEILSVNAELPEMVNVRCDECVAIDVRMAPQQVAKPWQIRLVKWFMLSGSVATVYLLIVLIQFLVVGTPLGFGG